MGCGAIVHSVSRTLGGPNVLPDDRWIQLLEFSNAFNSTNRRHMFEEIRCRNTILSQCKVQQGDPLGPLEFSLMLQPIVKCIKAKLPGLQINAWYLNAGTLCGSHNDLAADNGGRWIRAGPPSKQSQVTGIHISQCQLLQQSSAAKNPCHLD